MRNLKRALSLGLTAAMISGLMVMGSSAASYADVTSENNVEAIEVLEAVGIMIGDENGNFNPDQNVTRNEMAVVMSNLMEYNVASYKDTSPFTDVPSWAEPYVAACWTNGITAGYSDTIYGGSDTVTTAQAALMLMKALGYFQYASDFGSDWQLATTRQGNAIDLFVGVDSGVTQAMTRNDVAQLVLNTLRAGTVEASTDGSWSIGDVTINNNVQYSYITSNQTYATAIDDARSTSNNSDAQRSIVELGEQLYQGDLKLNNNAVDNFGRPARTWSYDGKEVGTYAKTELLVQSYTTAVTGREVYDLLSAATINENDLDRYVDGFGVDMDKDVLGRNNKDDLEYTGNGALTEVYLDDDNDLITIATINTYLAQAGADYSEGKEYAPLEVYMGLRNDKVVPYTYNVDVDDVAEIADVVDEEFYLVNISFADATSLTDYSNSVVTDIADPEVMENSTVTKWSDDSNRVVKKLTVDGTEYNAAVKAFYDEDTLDQYDSDLLTDMTYTLYLDQYGYVIGVDVYEGDLKYVFITGYDRNSSNLSVSTADAAAIFLDGTMDEIKVNVKNTNDNIPDKGEEGYDPYYVDWESHGAQGGDPTLNRWYKYSVNESGVYTLKPADMTATLYDEMENGAYKDVTINTASVSVRDNQLDNKTRVYGEDESVYVTVDTDLVDTTSPVKRAITDVNGVYTGVQNVNLEVDTSKDTIDTNIEAQVYTVYDKDNYVIGAVVIGDVSGSGDYAYILSDGATSEEKIGDTYYWEFDAILDGQVQTLTAKSKYHEVIDKIAANQFDVLELRFDTDDYVVRALDPDAADVYDYFDAIAPSEPDITDYEVYYIDSADRGTGNSLELNLQGRTLYITDDQDDYGLAIASDAPAVVIQDEYNKTDVKSEFTTVSAAIAHLADPYAQTPEVEYNGKIFAVLNTNGSAAWIVFDSRTNLDTSSGIHGSTAGNLPTALANGYTDPTYDLDLEGSRANAELSVNEFGLMTATVNYTAPEWVPTGATVTLDNVPVLYYGSATGKTAKFTGTVGADGKATLYYASSTAFEYSPFTASALSFGAVPAGDETFSRVKVYWLDEKNDSLADVLTGETEHISAVSSNLENLKATLDNTSSGNATITSKNLHVNWLSDSLAYSALDGGWTSNSGTPNNYADSSAAPVIVVLDIHNLENLYSVNNAAETATALNKLYGATPAAFANSTLQVTLSRDTGIQAGGTVVVTGATLNPAVGTSSDVGLKVTLSNGTVLYFANTSSTAAKVVDGSFTVNGNMNLTVQRVETVAAPTITEVEYKDVNGSGDWDAGDTVVVHFSEALSDAPNRGGNVASKFTAIVNSDKSVITYTVATSQTLTAGDTLTFSNSTGGFVSAVTGVTQNDTYTIIFGSKDTNTEQPTKS